MKEQKILQTKDYSIFGNISANREVDKKHVKRLAAAISENNLLHINPIIVNAAMQVIDGQHRLQAAKSLGVPVYYVQDANVSKGQIAALNTNQKNWSTMDYVNFWTVEKRPGFKELSKFINRSKLPVSAAVNLLSEDTSGALKYMREGSVDISNLDQANEIVEFMQEIAEQYDYEWFLCGGIAYALRKMWEHPEFSPEKLAEKIAIQPRAVVRCTSNREYLKMLSEVYNFKVQYKLDFFSRRREDSDG